jgi:hypothetical protein
VVYRYALQPERRFAYVSPGVTALVGYSPEEHYGDPDLGLKVIHPEDAPLVQLTAGGGTPLDGLVMRWRHRNGGTVWTVHRTAPVRDAEGRVVALDGAATRVATETPAPGVAGAALSATDAAVRAMRETLVERLAVANAELRRLVAEAEAKPSVITDPATWAPIEAVRREVMGILAELDRLRRR